MKSTGIIRHVDELGRIVIPMELRNKLKIKIKDPIEIYVDGSYILLKKYQDSCIFCNSTKNLIKYNDKLVCSKCASNLLELNKKDNQ